MTKRKASEFLHFPYSRDVVYFFQIVDDIFEERRNGLVKIGRSKDPTMRANYLSWQEMAKLQILGWTNGSEPEWHNRFMEQRVAGEWFRMSDELMSAIRTHCDPSKFGDLCYLPEEPRFVGGYYIHDAPSGCVKVAQ